MDYRDKKEIFEDFLKEFPILKLLEEKRKKTLFRMFIIELVLVIIPILYIVNFNSVIDFFEQIYAPGLFITSWVLILTDVFLCFFYPFWMNARFKAHLKDIVLPKALKYFKAMKHSVGENIFDSVVLEKSTLFSRFNSIMTDDAFWGCYNNVKFKISESELGIKTQKNYFTSFKGVIIIVDSNKPIKAKTIVTTARDLDILNNPPISAILYIILIPLAMCLFDFWQLGGINKHIEVLWYTLLPYLVCAIFLIVVIIFNLNKKRKQINLEDVNFAKKFKVSSEDEVESRYLITPAFMERFLNLTTSFGTRKIKCAFFDNKIMFAISTGKNLFEFGSLFSSIVDMKNIRFFRELMSILDMIDYFMLDEKIGL